MKTENSLNVYGFEDYEEIFEEHGIVYIKRKGSKNYTVYLKKNPGVICEVEDKKLAPFKIKELLDCIEGWEN